MWTKASNVTDILIFYDEKQNISSKLHILNGVLIFNQEYSFQIIDHIMLTYS